MKKNSVILSLQLSRAFSNHVSSRHLSSSQVLREKYQQSQNNGSKSSWNYAFGSLAAATTFAGIFFVKSNLNSKLKLHFFFSFSRALVCVRKAKQVPFGGTIQKVKSQSSQHFEKCWFKG